jgi:hypothetical protein
MDRFRNHYLKDLDFTSSHLSFQHAFRIHWWLHKACLTFGQSFHDILIILDFRLIKKTSTQELLHLKWSYERLRDNFRSSSFHKLFTSINISFLSFVKQYLRTDLALLFSSFPSPCLTLVWVNAIAVSSRKRLCYTAFVFTCAVTLLRYCKQASPCLKQMLTLVIVFSKFICFCSVWAWIFHPVLTKNAHGQLTITKGSAPS